MSGDDRTPENHNNLPEEERRDFDTPAEKPAAQAPGAPVEEPTVDEEPGPTIDEEPQPTVDEEPQPVGAQSEVRDELDDDSETGTEGSPEEENVANVFTLEQSVPAVAAEEDAVAGEAPGEESIETPDEVLHSRLESLIFVSPDPISVRRLANILSLEGKKVRQLMTTLSEHYQHRGILLEEVAGGFQFRSHPDNAAVIKTVFKVKPLRLSRSALETLAIVAYRQPLTRAEVEDIRGVDSGATLKMLFEKELVRVLGRREGPGRPIIYGTSAGFLELFGLKALSDLPPLHEFSDLWDEHQEMVDRDTPAPEGDEDAGGSKDLASALDGPPADNTQIASEAEIDSDTEVASEPPTDGWNVSETQPDATPDELDVEPGELPTESNEPDAYAQDGAGDLAAFDTDFKEESDDELNTDETPEDETE